MTDAQIAARLAEAMGYRLASNDRVWYVYHRDRDECPVPADHHDLREWSEWDGDRRIVGLPDPANDGNDWWRVWDWAEAAHHISVIPLAAREGQYVVNVEGKESIGKMARAFLLALVAALDGAEEGG